VNTQENRAGGLTEHLITAVHC